MSILTFLHRALSRHKNLPDESPAIQQADTLIDRAERVTAQQERETASLQWRLAQLADLVRSDDIAPLPRIWSDDTGRGR